ncbi:RNA-directed DNA polymerase [Arthrobacter sp. R-11]|uniref:RNA-directed DNA polymerase n=1 Tax=Arthrobacter sp. R-11 TaxID=3404053 RepID=UPI003CF7DD62
MSNSTARTSSILDFEAAAKLLKLEAYGDWYRDPWSWFELEPEVVKKMDMEADLGFARRVKASGNGFGFDVSPSFHLLTIPKSFTGVRPGVVIDPASKLVYTAAASQIATRMHGGLSEWVYGWRLRDGEATVTTDERKLYEDSVSNIRGSRWALQTDITSFFASTDIDNLMDDIRSIIGRTAATDAVDQVLRAHMQLPERQGLPQRCYASSYLANLAVAPVDDVIGGALSNGRISSARRWMDDISVEAEDLAELYRLIVEIQAAMRRAGLEINTSKTHLTSGKKSHTLLKKDSPDKIELQTLLLMNSYTDEIEDAGIDLAPLAHAEEHLLRNPRGINRGEGAMVLRALRKYEKTDRYLEWRKIAHQLPHLADSLGRYFASAIDSNGRARAALERWFVVFERSPWASLEWVSTQYAMAFSSTNLPPSIGTILHGWLKSSHSLQQVSLAAQRLSIVDPKLARATISARSSHEMDPQVQRALALGLAAAGGGQRDVRELLARSKHNRLTTKALELRGWRPPKDSHDVDPVTG